MKRTALLLLALTGMAFISACSAKTHELKSPCVGAEGSPCERRPANVGWQA